MTLPALTVMCVSVGGILTLVAFCFYQVLNLPPAEDEDLKGPLKIEAGLAELVE